MYDRRTTSSIPLGPLEALMEDAEITEIMVNGPDRIFVEREGRKGLSEVRFETDQQLRFVVERLLTQVPGKRLDESSPFVDLALPDGSRVNIVIPPLVNGGPHVTIRKYNRPVVKLEDFVARGAMDRRMAQFLYGCIRARLNVLFSGGTGVGKTTMLEVLGNYIDDEERIIVIEDTAELHFRQHNVVRMLTRPSNLEGKGEISSGELFKNSLRMTPSRIILGEIRGREALDYLQSMNSGHEGGLAILHAATPDEAVIRLENLVALSGMNISARVVSRQIAFGLDVIVQLVRFPDGVRRITHITAVEGQGEDGEVQTRDIFRFREEGVGPNGEVLGRYVAAGHVPAFHDRFKMAGVPLGRGVYRPDGEAQDTPNRPAR